mmetsp:Transcript_29592/g.90785  ORF Transcript_29592/g.90785 Transcript_29592/m.90785 type:complete len:230 (-) Transcript_29592:365-1054(-)
MREVARSPAADGRPMGFTLLRVPFFLEPDYPTDPAFEETNRTRLLRKWGGKEGWDAQKARHTLKERGREVGIEHFNLDRIASNTLASHRMVQWVTRTLGINAAESMYADLNMRHFEAGQKLNDVDMLVKAAEKVGADPRAARSFIESNEGKDEIEAAQRRLASLGISGIPTLILGGKWQLPSGALGASTLVEVFRKIEQEGGAPGPPLFAGDLNLPANVVEETLELELT